MNAFPLICVLDLGLGLSLVKTGLVNKPECM